MVSRVVQGYRCTGDVHGFRVTGCRNSTGVRGTGVVEVFNGFRRSTGVQTYMSCRGIV
jgi:hypothetical protein